MEVQNEQQYPLVKLVQKQALELELDGVQALQVQPQVQALARVQAQAQLEPLVRVQAQLEPLVQAQPQVQLELERHLQRSCPKLQLHRHRCKVPDRSRESQ